MNAEITHQMDDGEEEVRMFTVRTSDGIQIPISQKLVDSCSTLRLITEMIDCSDAYASFGEIPLPNVDAELMKKIKISRVPEFTEPEDLFPLLKAADYLGYEKFVDEIAKTVANSLKGRSAPEVLKIMSGI